LPVVKKGLHTSRPSTLDISEKLHKPGADNIILYAILNSENRLIQIKKERGQGQALPPHI